MGTQKIVVKYNLKLHILLFRSSEYFQFNAFTIIAVRKSIMVILNIINRYSFM